MSEETTEVTPGSSEEQARADNNPMLARNAAPTESKTDDQTQPEVKLPAEQAGAPEAPKQEANKQDPRKGSIVRDALGTLDGDPQLKPVGEFLALKLGDKVDLDRAFGNAVERGDTTLIDEAYLREALGDEADTVVSLAKGLFDAAVSKAEAAVKAVYSAHGGENTVKQAIAFYNTKADASERAAMAVLLDSGNSASIEYAMKHIVKFASGAGGISSPKAGAVPLGQPGAQRGLSAAEYQKLVGEAHIKRQASGEFERLASLRRLGRQQGI